MSRGLLNWRLAKIEIGRTVKLEHILLDGRSLTVGTLSLAAEGSVTVEIAPEGLKRMADARALVDHAIEHRIPVYGVTTGLGARATEALDDETPAEFSLQTIKGRAHAIGAPLSDVCVRALILMRLNTMLTDIAERARIWPFT